jgi:hypothetical protein
MRTTISLLAAIAALALAGCGNAEPAAAPATASSSSSSSSTSTTSSPTTSDTPILEPTTVTPTPGEGSVSFDCQDGGVGEHYISLKEVWAADTAYECDADATGYTPTVAQAKAVAAYLKSDSYYGDEGTQGALEDLLGMCAAKDMAEETAQENEERIPFVLKVCPTAPHIKMLRAVANGDIFQDGDQTVGEDIKPGTYKTGHVSDCYWERTTNDGQTLANDFVKLAPGGVTVTIRPTDGGFTSEGCGPWRRVR